MNIFVIFIISFFTRLSQFFWMRYALGADAKVYDDLARSIVNWGFLTPEMLTRFPLKDHPLYPLFLAVNYYLFGENSLAILISQSFLGASLCVIVYLIATEFFNHKTSLLAGCIAALYPVFMKLSGLFLSEGLFVFIFTFSLWAVVKYIKTQKLNFLLYCSFLLGLATLTRSVVILFMPLLSVYFFFLDKGRLKLGINLLRQAVFMFIFILTVFPWTIRNYYVSGGSIIPVTEDTDRGFYNSFCPHKGKIFGIRPNDDPVMIEARKISSFKERRKFFLKKTFEFIRNNPGKVIKLEILKVFYLWSPLDWEFLGDGQARYNFGFVFIMPFFIYGGILLWRSINMQKFILFLPILYFQAIHLVYFALPRFRIGFEPVLIVLGAFGIMSFYEKAKNRKVALTVVLAFLFLNIILFIFSLETKVFLREICERIGLW